MSSNTEWAERRDQALKELSELGMTLARDLAGRVQAIESLDDAERCAQAFDRIARSVRLTFALQGRLAREDRRELNARHADAVQHRKAQVRAAFAAPIRAEPSIRELLDRERELDDRLAEESLYAAFLEGPVEAVIARIREELGLPPEAPANDAAEPIPRLPCPWKGEAPGPQAAPGPS